IGARAAEKDVAATSPIQEIVAGAAVEDRRGADCWTDSDLIVAGKAGELDGCNIHRRERADFLTARDDVDVLLRPIEADKDRVVARTADDAERTGRRQGG